MMGISLVAMTVFLYPVFGIDSEELASGMLLFRGALEGTWMRLTSLIRSFFTGQTESLHQEERIRWLTKKAWTHPTD